MIKQEPVDRQLDFFAHLGPDAIPLEVAKAYQSLPPPSDSDWTIEALFDLATDENNSDDFRILAWRDLLLQDGLVIRPTPRTDASGATHSMPAPYYCHNTGEHYLHLLHLGDNGENGKALRETFRKRPKLAKEFARQLEYNLRSELMGRDKFVNRSTDECDTLITILLPLVDEEMSKELWKHHSCFSVREQHNFGTYCEYADICKPEAKMPAWLVEELGQDLRSKAQEEAQTLGEHHQVTLLNWKIPDSHRRYPAIMAHLYRINEFNLEREPDLATLYIAQFDEMMPKNYVYFDFSTLMRIAPQLTTDAVVYDLLARHLPPLLDGNIIGNKMPFSYSKKIDFFFLWAIGFVKEFEQTVPACARPEYDFTTLEQQIAKIHRTAKTSGSIRLY